MKKLLKNLLKWFKNWNGFLTKKDGYISKPELHATAIGFSTFGTAYLLPSPLGELMVVSYVMLLRTIYRRLGELEGHLHDIAHEYAYMTGAVFVTVLFFETQTSYMLTEIAFNQLIRSMLGV